MITRAELEDIVGRPIADFSKYLPVFVHKSAVRDVGIPCFERLEYVGDAVLGVVIAKYLFDAYPQADESFLTRIRTKLVCHASLAYLATRLGLSKHIQMSHKALSHGWNTNPKIAEDCFEALVGAIYLDLGMVAAREFIVDRCIRTFVNWDDVLVDTNWKDGLMRYAQARGLEPPAYALCSTPDTGGNFRVAVCVEGLTGQGFGSTKKGAEQIAARETLRQLGFLGPKDHVAIPVIR